MYIYIRVREGLTRVNPSGAPLRKARTPGGAESVPKAAAVCLTKVPLPLAAMCRQAEGGSSGSRGAGAPDAEHPRYSHSTPRVLMTVAPDSEHPPIFTLCPPGYCCPNQKRVVRAPVDADSLAEQSFLLLHPVEFEVAKGGDAPPPTHTHIYIYVYIYIYIYVYMCMNIHLYV